MRLRFVNVAVASALFAACFSPDLANAQAAGADSLVATMKEWGGESGVFTCQQWRAYAAKMFRVGDKNHRGYLDAVDFERIKAVSPVFEQASFDFFDQTGKGKISQKEFVEAQSPFFAMFDRKHTCRVTYDDIAAANAPKAANAPQERSGRSGNSSGGNPGGIGGFGWRDH
jgi:hypothetical protein